MIARDTTLATKKLLAKEKVKLRRNSDEESMDSEEMGSTDEKLNGSEAESGEYENKDYKVGGNPGWADAMQKILKIKKPKRKKSIVLSKAKKLCDVIKTDKSEEVPFDIEKVKEEVKTEEAGETEIKEEKSIILLKKKKNNLGIRIKPSIMDRERERILQKIATKGVVQLFNAVRQQQGVISNKLAEAGPLERKREQVLKSINKCTFLDVLMSGSKSIPTDSGVKKEEKNNNNDKEMWNVLREDFVMGTKLKDWDRKDDSCNDSSAPEDIDSDN